MPSGPKKRKSKRKNKLSVSPPHQGWLRTHMKMLKGPSLGNGSKGKEKNNPAEQETERDMKEMDSLENEGSQVSDTSTVVIQPEAETSQNADDLKMPGLDDSKEAIEVTETTESAVSNGVYEHSLSSDINVDRSHGLEELDRENEDTQKFGVDSSLKNGASSQKDASALASEQVNEQAAVGKAEVTPVLEANVPASENDGKLMVDADGFMEALQNGEMDANTPKTEIPHPPMVLRHAPVWNCCGLLEVLMSFQH